MSAEIPTELPMRDGVAAVMGFLAGEKLTPETESLVREEMKRMMSVVETSLRSCQHGAKYFRELCRESCDLPGTDPRLGAAASAAYAHATEFVASLNNALAAELSR